MAENDTTALDLVLEKVYQEVGYDFREYNRGERNLRLWSATCTRSDESYLVNSDSRQMVSFSYFDLVSTKTLPFTNLDCIFCCNILIYLQKQLQEKVLGLVEEITGEKRNDVRNCQYSGGRR